MHVGRENMIDKYWCQEYDDKVNHSSSLGEAPIQT